MPLGDKIKSKKAQEANQNRTFILGGRYEVDRNHIGKGVSSVVMTAIDLETHQKVAVKKITKFF